MEFKAGGNDMPMEGRKIKEEKGDYLNSYSNSRLLLMAAEFVCK
jgi:hypothetical protein